MPARQETCGDDQGKVDQACNPFALFGAVIEADHRDQAVVEAVDRHEKEGLELKIGAQDKHAGGGEKGQELIHPQGHDGGQRLHDHGGKADFQDLQNDGTRGAETARLEDEHPAAAHQKQTYGHTDQLSDHGGQGGPGHLQAGERPQTENEQGVQEQIDHRADALDAHGPHRVSAGLEHPLPRKLHTHAERARGDDGKVLTAVVDDLRYVGEQRQKGAAEQHARNQKDQPAAQVEEVAVHCHGAGLGGAAFPQAAGEYGVYADAGPHADGNHQGLYRIGQGQRHKSVGAELGHEHAVHQIIQGLDQHGEHHGP